MPGRNDGTEKHSCLAGKEERAPESLPSPGVGIRHYAPRAKVVLVEGSEAAVRKALPGAGRVGVMLPDGWAISERGDRRTGDLAGIVVWRWGAWDRPEELAARLFAGLRELDATGAERIVCPLPEEGAVRDAIRDRLMKAARE